MIRLILFLLSIALSLSPATAMGQSEPTPAQVQAAQQIMQDFEQGRALLSSGDPTNWQQRVRRAAGLLEGVITRAESLSLGEEYTAPLTVEARLLLGGAYFQDYRFDAAETVLLRARNDAETFLGPEDLRLPSILTYLGAVYDFQGRSSEAEVVFRQAVSIYQAAAEPNPARLGGAFYALSGPLADQAKLAEAEAALREALSLRRAVDPQSILVAQTLGTLAEVVVRQSGRNAEARALSQESLELYMLESPSSPGTASALGILAGLDSREGRYAEAEAGYRAALDIYRQENFPPNASSASLEAGLAMALLAKGGFRESEALQRRALSEARRRGPHSPILAEHLLALASTLIVMEEPERATGVLDEALRVGLSAYCPDADTQIMRGTINAQPCLGTPNLAYALASQGAFALAYQDSPFHGVRRAQQASDMIVRRTRASVNQDPQARLEFAGYAFTHRQFVSASWAAVHPGDRPAIAASLHAPYWVPTPEAAMVLANRRGI